MNPHDIMEVAILVFPYLGFLLFDLAKNRENPKLKVFVGSLPLLYGVTIAIYKILVLDLPYIPYIIPLALGTPLTTYFLNRDVSLGIKVRDEIEDRLDEDEEPSQE